MVARWDWWKATGCTEGRLDKTSSAQRDEVEVLEEVLPADPAVEEIRDAAEGDVEAVEGVMEEVDPGDLNGREVVEVEEIIIDEVVHEGLVGGNGGVEQFGLDESLIEALIGGEDVVGEAEDGQVVAEAMSPLIYRLISGYMLFNQTLRGVWQCLSCRSRTKPGDAIKIFL